MDSQRQAEKTALVTGAGGGIGRSTALRLAKEGSDVVVLDVRADAAEKVAAEVAEAGGQSLGLRCDVGDESSVEAAVSAAVQRFGRLNTIVACAGIALDGATDALSLAEWELVLRINLTGTFLILKHTLPHLVAAGGGSIVTVGSVASLVAAGRASSYDASKGGVLQLTRAVAVEYADRNVRANCLCPGVTATDLGRNSQAVGRSGAGGEPASRPLRVDVPISRRADPAEMAGVIAFLCSDDASFVTGAAIAADGGYTAV
jgi:NAD(P)-dependent dehydrogenase (short-subunit alcohol dehydrogenase family)